MTSNSLAGGSPGKTRIERNKELYGEEWSRRTTIESGVSLPVGILTALGGAIFYLTTSFAYRGDPLTIFFVVAAAGSSVAFLVAAWFVFRTLVGPGYLHIPAALELRHHDESLQTYHGKTGGTLADAEHDFESYLSDRYAEAADQNTWSNIKKSERLFRSHLALGATLGFLLIAAVPAGIRVVQQRPNSLPAEGVDIGRSEFRAERGTADAATAAEAAGAAESRGAEPGGAASETAGAPESSSEEPDADQAQVAEVSD